MRKKGQIHSPLEMDIQDTLQKLYDREIENEMRKHNGKPTGSRWKRMKTPYRRKLHIYLYRQLERLTVEICAGRIQIAGMRGAGSTFTYQGRMLLPRSHILKSQVAIFLIGYLSRKDKTASIGKWSESLAFVDISPRMLKSHFNRICSDLGISLGERPSRLYRCAGDPVVQDFCTFRICLDP